MKTQKLLVAAVVLLLASCKKNELTNKPSAQQEITKEMINENGNNPDETMLNADNNRGFSTGHVYIESNDAGTNAILVYKQGWDGKLTWVSKTWSGGNGLGAPLGSQGAIAMSKDHQWLFAVNAGSGSVSSFKVNSDGSLTLAHTASTGGTKPISVCVYNDLVYVVNAGTADIHGFKVASDGSLISVNASNQSLSDAAADPAQIAFSPGGHSVLVTEKMTNKISAFPVNASGAAGARVSTPSVGTTPFGFDISRDHFMIVSNAEGEVPNASTCTSYKDLYLHPTDANGAVPNHQTAACWVSTTKFGRFAFVANAGSNTINSYFVDFWGNIYFIPWGVTNSGKGPIDTDVSGNNLFVYNINSMSHTIGQFRRWFLGTLIPLGEVPNLPDFAAGLVAN